MKTKKSKSRLIREHLLSLPPSRRSPAAVAKALNAKGIKVTSNLVSVVKFHLPSIRERDTTARDLVLAKKLLEAAGGVEQARRLISIVDKVVGR